MAARLASKALHDARALDWQAERENLIDPRKPTSTEMLTGGRRKGRGATPSMGLSQVRGGIAKSGRNVQPTLPTLGMAYGANVPEVSFGLIGLGKGNKAHIEPLLLGRELAKHLVGKYGEGYAKAFVGGCMASCGGGMKGGAIDWGNIDWNAPWSWDDFFEGFKEGAMKTIGVAKHVLPFAGEEGKQLKEAIDKLGFGRRRGGMKGGVWPFDSIDYGKPSDYTWDPAAFNMEDFWNGFSLPFQVIKKLIPLAGEDGKEAQKVIDAYEKLAGGNLSKSGAYEGHGHMKGGVWPFDEGDIDWNAPWSWDDFAQGFQTGFKKTMGVGKNVLPFLGPEGIAMKGAIDALGFGKKGAKGGRTRRGGGGIVGGARPTGSWNGEPAPEAYQAGPALDQARAQAQAMADRAAKDMPVGAGKHRRRGAGPGDGRRARAEIVREVMNKHGLKLIEASKYVKAHGLYKGKE